MDRSTKNAQGPLSQLNRPSQHRFHLRIQVPGSTPAPNPAPKGNPFSESSFPSSTSDPGVPPKIDWSLDPRPQALLEVGIQLPTLIQARNPAPKLEFRSESSSHGRLLLFFAAPPKPATAPWGAVADLLGLGRADPASAAILV